MLCLMMRRPHEGGTGTLRGGGGGGGMATGGSALTRGPPIMQLEKRSTGNPTGIVPLAEHDHLVFPPTSFGTSLKCTD